MISLLWVLIVSALWAGSQPATRPVGKVSLTIPAPKSTMGLPVKFAPLRMRVRPEVPGASALGVTDETVAAGAGAGSDAPVVPQRVLPESVHVLPSTGTNSQS